MIKNIGELTQILTEKNIKPSFQRLKILEFLLESKDHPTVEEIYLALSPEIPTLSKTTIYNTLNIFIDAGIARILNIENNETRYDAVLIEHGHFKCNQCGKIFDFNINMDKISTKALAGFEVMEKDVFLKGVCADCLNKNKKDKQN